MCTHNQLFEHKIRKYIFNGKFTEEKKYFVLHGRVFVIKFNKKRYLHILVQAVTTPFQEEHFLVYNHFPKYTWFKHLHVFLVSFSKHCNLKINKLQMSLFFLIQENP